MADARSLLRAAATQRAPHAAGITDRWASYHPKTGALRCAACDMVVVKHERLWGAHTASKSHRANVRAMEEREAQEQTSDRAVEEPVVHTEQEDTLKRKDADEPDVTGATEVKRTRRETDSETDAAPALDKEWEEFQRTVIAPSNAKPSSYDDATITAAPELVRDQVAEAPQEEETEEERRARLEREEREDILARIDAEQRAQAEADERYVFSLTRRVLALRARFDRIREARHRRSK